VTHISGYEVVKAPKAIFVGAIVSAIALYAILSWRSLEHVSQAGFWFENVTFESPHLVAAGYGGPITEAEARIIRAVALSEVKAAFAGLRIRFSEDREAFYRVRVVQEFGPGIRGAAGASRVIAPIGGNGSVNYLMLSSQAVSHAPLGADRSAVVQAMGRGVGRAAVHEFLHQMLPRLNIHDSKDDRSYEYAYSSRPAQYYGDMRWDIARPALLERFGDVQKHQDAR
jgi:hypothetical protein